MRATIELKYTVTS